LECIKKEMDAKVFIVYCAEGYTIPHGKRLGSFISHYLNVWQNQEEIDWKEPCSWIYLNRGPSFLDENSKIFF